MATLQLTVPDAAVPRIRAAFAHQDGTPATVADVQAALLGYLKLRVKDYEGAIARNSAQASIDAEVNAW